MKKVLILLIAGLCTVPLFADHLELSPLEKYEFIKQRLRMLKSSLTSKKELLLQLKGSIKALTEETQKRPLISRMSLVKKEISDLEDSIPVMKSSLNALQDYKGE